MIERRREDKGDWREEGRRRMPGERKEGEGCLERGRKEKDDWREEGWRGVIGGRKDGEE